MTVSVVLFTSDLRLHDNPTLHAALSGADEVVPLFVLDEAIASAGFATPNRRAFLADCLTDLDAGLRERGGRLVVRTGDVVARAREVAAEAGADEVRTAGGVSRYAQRREERLRRELESDGRRLRVHDATLTALRRAPSHRTARITSRSSPRTSAAGRASARATYSRRPGPYRCRPRSAPTVSRRARTRRESRGSRGGR